MNNTPLAPIVLFVYNRPWHTQQTIEALQKNELASESELFIYSDAAKNEIVAPSVESVRSYIKQITGFKKITIIERDKNWGLANSIIDGVTTIVNQYGKIIVLEDDLLTSPYFLIFMNEALTFFKENSKLFSISGYTYPFELPETYQDDIFVFYRSSSWGWATWKDRWNKIDFDVKNYEKILLNKTMQKSFNRGGDDLFNMLKMQINGKIDSWAIRFAFGHFVHNAFTLFPSKSLVRNIGHDGSGTHCISTSDWEVLIKDNFLPKLNEVLDIDFDIEKRLQKKFRMPFLNKVKQLMRELLK